MLYKKIEKWSYLLRFYATYHEMKYYLKRALKTEQDYMKKIGHYDRCIGKSVALLRLSIKYNVPIVVPMNTYKKRLLDITKYSYISKYFKKKTPKIYVVCTGSGSANAALFGKIRNQVVLVEECTEEDQIKLLKDRGCIIVGYKNR